MSAAFRLRRWLTLVASFLVALAFGLVTSFSVERYLGQERVLRGVEVDSVPLAGLDHEELISLLTPKAEELARRRFALKLAGTSLEATGSELGLELPLDEVARVLLVAGRTGGLVEQLRFWLARLSSVHSIALPLRIDAEKLEARVEPWAREHLPSFKAPEILFKEKLLVEFGQGGRVVDFDALRDDLLLLERGRLPSVVTLPTKEEEAAVSRSQVELLAKKAASLLSSPIHLLSEKDDARVSLSAQELGAALSSTPGEGNEKMSLSLSLKELRRTLEPFLREVLHPAKDAHFDFSLKGEPSVTKSEKGERLNEDAFIERIWKASASPAREVILPLEVEAPDLTTEAAEALGIKGLVSSFTTRHPCCRDRVKNIHLAASKLDGVVVKPGERLSLNELLGPRSRAAGYLEAPTIVHGKMKKSFGGGISQLATTLFNAVLRGGYEIIQRQPHSIYFPRYPEGHEATVSFPEPDLIFKNDTEAGLVLKTQFSGTFIKVLVYGDNQGRRVKRKKSKRYKIVEPPKEYEADPEMDPEESKRLRAGQLGWTLLVTTEVTHADGRKSEAKREVVYNPRPELLRVHPCVIPKGGEGYTGEDCPEPEREEREEELSDEYFETEASEVSQ